MLLTIDCGNTNTVFAIFDGETALGEWRASTVPERTADEYAIWLMQLMSLRDLSREVVTAAIVSTVVPQALYSLRVLCRQYFECEAMVVGTEGVNLGIEIKVDRPGDVGADRLVNAVGAHVGYAGPLVIVDFGTATTFDAVDADGNYLGGAIAPGINLSLEALHMAAAQLPRIAIGRPHSVIGKDTIGAMRSGIFWGYVGLIEGLVRRIIDEHGAAMKVIATGGLAPLFADATDSIDSADADLTIRGLLEIHRRNAG
jgi:type III pantothenate kinase